MYNRLMEPGYYWAKWAEEQIRDNPCYPWIIIEFSNGEIYLMGDEFPSSIELFTDFSGPLVPSQITS